MHTDNLSVFICVHLWSLSPKNWIRQDYQQNPPLPTTVRAGLKEKLSI
ncbi:hypothetical protein [Chlorogloeopsis fritschii]|nr:hypothetical protein [Chlorogloeopsis fritschii]